MRIVCVSCETGAPEIEEEKYASHMAQKHPQGQLGTIKAKRNVPQVDLPPGINEADLPSPEFLATVAEIEQAESKPKESAQTPQGPSTPVVPKPEIKPLELTYEWKGNCPTCNTPAQTFILEAKGSFFAVAFCISHKQLESKEVPSLKTWKEVAKETEIKKK